jgi:hypothetical protein
MLNKAPYDRPTPSFWQRNHHDVLVQRWASIVGPENVTVVVLDEADRGFLLRTFEELLGLPAGLLAVVPTGENRSLTLGEIELLRQVNIEFRRRNWSDALYKKVVRDGFGAQMQTRTPSADELRITTPRWARERAAEIGAAAAKNLAASGVRIVGDVWTLGRPAEAEEPDETAVVVQGVAVGAAREAVVGTIVSSGLLTTSAQVESTPAIDLLRVVLRRCWRRVRRAPRWAKRA